MPKSILFFSELLSTLTQSFISIKLFCIAHFLNQSSLILTLFEDFFPLAISLDLFQRRQSEPLHSPLDFLAKLLKSFLREEKLSLIPTRTTVEMYNISQAQFLCQPLVIVT